MALSINNHCSLISLASFLLLSLGLSAELVQGDCKFYSASRFQITVIAVAADLFLTNQWLFVDKLIVPMAVHMTYLSILSSVWRGLWLGSPFYSRKQRCHRCRRDNCASCYENPARRACNPQVQQAQREIVSLVAKEQIKCLSTRDENHPHPHPYPQNFTFSWKWSRSLVCPSQKHRPVPPFSLTAL